MIHKAMIAIGILLGSILIVENFLFQQTGYILFWYTSTGVLVIISMIIGAILGIGITGLSRPSDHSSDDFDY